MEVCSNNPVIILNLKFILGMEVTKFRTREANLFDATMLNESTAMDSKVITRGIKKYETSPDIVNLVAKSFAYTELGITELPERPKYFNNYKAEKVEVKACVLGDRKVSIERFLSSGNKKEYFTIKLSSITLKQLTRAVDGPGTIDRMQDVMLDLNRAAKHLHEMFILKAEGLVLRPKVSPKLAGAASHKEWLANMLRSPVFVTRRKTEVVGLRNM